MFTGLITHLGVIKTMKANRIEIQCVIDPVLGESIALDGICLTVVDFTKASFTVEVSPETQAVTTVQQWAVGKPVNLEKSLKIGDRLGGHFVMGHVDGTVQVAAIKHQGEFSDYRFTDLPADALAYIVKKGSVALNGVSLTVNQVTAQDFSVMLIPHTLEQTNLRQLAAGDRVNIEYDYLARYIRGEMHVCNR